MTSPEQSLSSIHRSESPRMSKGAAIITTVSSVSWGAAFLTVFGGEINARNIEQSAAQSAYTQAGQEIQASVDQGVIFYDHRSDTVNIDVERLNTLENSSMRNITSAELASQASTFDELIEDEESELNATQRISIGSRELPIVQDDLFKIATAELAIASGVLVGIFSLIKNGRKKEDTSPTAETPTL